MEEVVENKKSNKVIKNIIMVAISNMFKLLAGVLVGFVIPKIMGDVNYGYYKSYILYLGYAGLFHLGFIDGIYLLYAGKKYEDLDKQKFRTLSKFLIYSQIIFSLIICLISLFFIKYDLGFIFLFVGLSLFTTNITTYYQFLSQVTERFKELSVVNLVQAGLQALSVIIFFILYKTSTINELQYKLFTITWTILLALITIWYIYKYRDITFGKANKIKDEFKLIKKLIIVGFPLLIANLVANLIMTIDKQFVNVLAINEVVTMGDFGVYSFAYTMLALITTIIAAISTVLYPVIKKYSEEELKNNYNKLMNIIAIVTAFSLLAYQPICFIVENFLVKYIGSLPIFRVILPGVIISSCVTMIIFNYYKTLNKQFKFFLISIFILIFSIVANVVAYFTTKQLISISVASVITLSIWYLVSEYILNKNIRIKNILYIVCISTSFYLITQFIENVFISFGVYFVICVVITILFFYKLIKNKFR